MKKVTEELKGHSTTLVAMIDYLHLHSNAKLACSPVAQREEME